MNGSIETDPPTGTAGQPEHETAAELPTVNGQSTPSGPRVNEEKSKSNNIAEKPTVVDEDEDAPGEEDVGSEAETEITSPVKKKEAQKNQNAATAGKTEKAPGHRIGSLPVPSGDNDDEHDSNFSPVPSTAVSVEKAASNEGVKEEEQEDESDKEQDSDALSSPRSNGSMAPSRPSSRSRAASEMPGAERTRGQWPNARKRKHRASSVSLPNKRASMGAPPRRARGLHSEGLGDKSEEKSPSPKRRHRRALSTQSALEEAAVDPPNKKRRSAPQGLTRDSKSSARPGWEESDASSETTSVGHADAKRPQRGIGRSTSTPGRPAGREHKRHVNKYGFTRLAEACEGGDLDLVKDWREKDPEQLELAEFAGNKPLQIAALNGNVEVVDYLIEQGCHIDCANVDKDTPLIDAAENGHLEVVNSLLKAGVDPMRQNLKGQQALDVVTDEVDDADEIRKALRQAIGDWNSDGARQRREEEEEQRHRAGPSKELHLLARTYENLLKLVQDNNRAGVREFLDARVPVDNIIIAAAAKTGDLYLVNMLLAEMTHKKAVQRAEKPMLSVLGTSHLEMVKSLTELDQFNPTYTDRAGRTWADLAEERKGPHWREEKALLQKLYDEVPSTKDRSSSSPVAKREHGKRRPVARPAEEDSEEDEAPKRKNGRRLMSKRDMRAVSGKADSDDSSDESSSDVATATEPTEEASMKPPGSPSSKRMTSRARAQSFSAQASKENSPRTRRRSSSLRGAADVSLPTVEEKVEDNDTAMVDREEAERTAEAEAEAARKKEEAAQAAKAEADAQRAAEQEARKLEAERKADEARRAEAERKVEELRKAEEDQQRKELELEAKKQSHRKAVLDSLPSAVAHVLDPTSTFAYDGDAALTYLAYHFTPLYVVKQEHADPDAPYLVMNVQAAPLLGPRGLELMLRADMPGFDGSMADIWETRNVSFDEERYLETMLASLPPHLPAHDADDDEPGPEGDAGEPIEQLLQRTADWYNATTAAKSRLRNGEAVLRYVRLDQVLASLHPRLRGVKIDVRFEHLPLPKPYTNGDGAAQPGSFVKALGDMLDRRPRPRTYVDGKCLPLVNGSALGTTPVRVIQQK